MSKLLLAAVTALQLLQVAVANAESDRIEPHQAFNDSSYCQFPQACDQSTPGTGHKFFRGNLTEDLITVERCYSFCFKNFSSSSGIAAHFPDIFAGDPCSANSADAFVCYAACLFSAKDALKRIFPGLSVPDNATCEHYCQLKDGICERAFPPNSDCMVQCKLETCRQYCRHVRDEFPNTTGPVNSGSVYFTMDFASNITLKRQGVLEFQPTLSGATPADGGVLGLVWKVSHQNGFVAYIPQHLPFLLIPDEVGPLYHIGSNMLAIRELQCYTLHVEAAVVTQFGVGSFSSPRPQCFYGNWHPRPPAGINMTLGFSRETGNLKFEVTAETPSPDDEYVTGYGVQVLGWYDGDDFDCLGTTQDLRAAGSVDFPNKEDIRLILDDTDRVFQLFPGLSSRDACVYWIGVYALPQKEFNAAGQPILFRGGYWQKSNVRALTFPDPTWNQTFDLERDHVTGLVDVTYTLTLTSHWRSIAILYYIEGILITQPHDNNHVVIQDFRDKITGITPSVTRYDFLLRNVPPIKENIGAYLFHVNYVTKAPFRARGSTIRRPDLFTPGVVVLPPEPPSRPRKLIFNFYLNFETNTFKGNATWLGPEMPEGKLIEYRYVLSSASASTIVGGTMSVEGTSAATDMSEENFVSLSADLTKQEYFNFSVRAVSEWGVEGEWAVETITWTTTQPPPTDREDQLSEWLVQIIAIIASFLLMAILLIVAIVPLIMWMRHSRTKSQGVAFEQKDVLKTSISSFLSFEGAEKTADAVDNVTLYEVVREEEELGSRTGLSVTDGSSESDVCDKYCSTVDAPLPVSSGYVVGIQYTSMHQ